MVLISRRECDELVKMGYVFSGKCSDGSLHCSHTKHKKYYLTESEYAMSDLAKIRNTRNIVTE